MYGSDYDWDPRTWSYGGGGNGGQPGSIDEDANSGSDDGRKGLEANGGYISITDGPGERGTIFGNDWGRVGWFWANRAKVGDSPLYFIARRGFGLTQINNIGPLEFKTTVNVTFNPNFGIVTRVEFPTGTIDRITNGYGVYGSFELNRIDSIKDIISAENSSAEIGGYNFSTTDTSANGIPSSETTRNGIFIGTNRPEELLGGGLAVMGAAWLGGTLAGAGAAGTLLEPVLQP